MTSPGRHILEISKGYVDPAQVLYDPEDRREVWYDPSLDRLVRPVRDDRALKAIGLLKKPFAVEEIDGEMVYQRRIRFPNDLRVWSSTQVRAQARFTLELYELLRGLRINLYDGHPYNVMFEGPHTRWVDLGSLRSPEGPAGSCLDQAHIYVAFAEFYRIGYCPQLREGGHFPSDDLEGLLKICFEALAEEDPVLSWTEKFYRLRDGDARDRDGTWVGYAPPLAEVDPEAHDDAFARTVIRVVEDMNVRSMLDIGCNNGRYSVIAARRGAATLALDIEDALICELFDYAAQADLPITPVVGDLANYGRISQEMAPPFRAQADLVLAYAIIHHLVHRSGYDFDRFFDEVDAFEPKVVVIGFVDYGSIDFVPPEERLDWYRFETLWETAVRRGFAPERVETDNPARPILVCRAAAAER